MVALLTVLLAVVLVMAAFGGPRLLRSAAPALATAPRFAAATVALGSLVWVAAMSAMGPAIAWVSDGPALLPQRAAEVCRQCLAESTPFGGSSLVFGIPAVVPLAIPALGAVLIVAGLIREMYLASLDRRRLAEQVGNTGMRRILLGRSVLVIPGVVPMAFAVPGSRAGIVVSDGALSRLSDPELAAVLEHEHAHLRQRHHMWLVLFLGATRYFRMIPLIRTARESVPMYLEIAADQAAIKDGGAVDLAGALLKLGSASVVETGSARPGSLLHASGPENDTGTGGTNRVRVLVGTPTPRSSFAVALVAGSYACLLFAAFLAVQWPYASAVLSGC